MKETITVGPLYGTMTNRNKAMNLPGHSHAIAVWVTYATDGEVGFPVFADTVAELAAFLEATTARPFNDHTNEAVARDLFAAFSRFQPPAAANYGATSYHVTKLRLDILGVKDKIGHNPGWATYEVASP